MTTMKTFTCAGVAPAMSPDVRDGYENDSVEACDELLGRD